MTWLFDQAPNVACVASSSVVAGGPVLVVIHFEDDHSWAFLDGEAFDSAHAVIVSMSELLDAHPKLDEIAALPPGWTARRTAVGETWSKQQDQSEQETWSL